MQNIKLKEPEEIIDDNINVFNDLVVHSTPEPYVSKTPAKTLFEKFEEIKQVCTQGKNRINPYSVNSAFRNYFSSEDYNELIDAGVFKKKENSVAAAYTVDLMFRAKNIGMNMLQAQTKILVDHDFAISNTEFRSHINSALDMNQHDYIHALTKEPCLEHHFHGHVKALARFQDESQTNWDREFSKYLAKEAYGESPYKEDPPDRPYSPLLTYIAHVSLQSQFDNDLADRIIEEHPATLDKISTNLRNCSYEDKRFSRLVDTQNKFDSIRPAFHENIYDGAHEKLRNNSNNETVMSGVYFIKFASSEHNIAKNQLVDTAIRFQKKDFLNEVAKGTEFRFNENQLESMKEKPSIFNEVLHNSAKKEVHDRLQKTLAPIQTKTKRLKI